MSLLSIEEGDAVEIFSYSPVLYENVNLLHFSALNYEIFFEALKCFGCEFLNVKV